MVILVSLLVFGHTTITVQKLSFNYSLTSLNIMAYQAECEAITVVRMFLLQNIWRRLVVLTEDHTFGGGKSKYD